MKTEPLQTSATCFGEVLWDVLPGGPQPGGAPLNVAYHLCKLGMPVHIISKIGNDEPGKRLEQLITGWGINEDLLQVDTHYPTSEVIARVGSNNEVSYEIVFPVAWDFINPAPVDVNRSKYFVYGSLASRNAVTRDTLFQLLEGNSIKVLDINLRPPFAERELLEMLLQKADIVKFNQAELEMAQLLFGGLMGSEAGQAAFIMSRFNVTELIVTKGEAGASYYTPGGTFHAAGVGVKVADTIGSGDSFLAAFLAGHAQQLPPQTILKNAVAMGAFIATKKGGCPDYELTAYEEFKNTMF